MRVLIADDHALIRAGLHALLLKLPGVHEVLEAGDGDAALQMVARHQLDVVLMDIAMPGMNGLQAMARIRENDRPPRVIILSMHAGEEYVGRALQSGASGYLVKTAGLAELQQALIRVTRGQTYVSPSVKLALGGQLGSPYRGPRERLTLRHRQVLTLICQGLKTREIANALGIHAKTVESHRAELMIRLGIRGIAGLVRYAIRIGLARVESSTVAGAAAGGD